MSLSNVKRGDLVFVASHGHRSSDPITTEFLKVVGVGPKYVTAGEGYKKTRFHRHNGVVVTDYSARVFAYATEEEWEAERRLGSLRARCERVVVASRIRELDAESLERLLAIFGEQP